MPPDKLGRFNSMTEENKSQEVKEKPREVHPIFAPILAMIAPKKAEPKGEQK